MKRLLKKILLFSIVFVGFTLILNVFNIKIIENTVFKINDDVNKLILGSSRSQCAIDDNVLKNTLNMSSAADSNFYSYLKLNNILDNNPQIDTVFISVSPRSISEFLEKRWLFNKSHFSARIGNYYYLMDKNDFQMLWNHFGLDFFKIGIPNIIVRSFKNFKEILIGDIKGVYGGYEALHRDKLEEALARLKIDIFEESELVESKIGIYYLEKIVNLCKRNNIKIFFISPPIRREYVKLKYNDYLKFDIFLNSKYADITYLDFTLFPMSDSEYADIHHLNHLGSKRFSQFLQEKGIENIILESHLNKYGFKSVIYK